MNVVLICYMALGNCCAILTSWYWLVLHCWLCSVEHLVKQHSYCLGNILSSSYYNLYLGSTLNTSTKLLYGHHSQIGVDNFFRYIRWRKFITSQQCSHCYDVIAPGLHLAFVRRSFVRLTFRTWSVDSPISDIIVFIFRWSCADVCEMQATTSMVYLSSKSTLNTSSVCVKLILVRISPFTMDAFWQLAFVLCVHQTRNVKSCAYTLKHCHILSIL
jgi:hypothetical protein